MPRAAPSYGDEAPIAATATPPAISALAVIRTSGEGSLALLSKVFSRPRALLDAPGNTIVHGWILDGAAETDRREKIDEVLISVYRSPKSYTGEEGADINCHGGYAAPSRVLEVLFKAGFRQALPGEFSFRAFLNGKIDLSSAEAVMELVSAKSEGALSNAARRLSGVLWREIDAIKGILLKALSAVEIELDYPPLDGVGGEEPSFPPVALDFLREALRRLAVLAAGYSYQNLCREGALVVIAGPPNAGKSSLFNYMVKEERAIVSPLPGTTRDWIECWISLGGVPIQLVDTAGLRESSDIVETSGIEKTRALLREADVLLFLSDASDDRTARAARGVSDNAFKAESGVKNVLYVLNKCDLVDAAALSAFPAPSSANYLKISAKTGEGVGALAEEIGRLLERTYGKGDPAAAGLGTRRQKILLDAAMRSAREAISLAEEEAALDIIAPVMRDAIDALGEITGEVTTDDILSEMFSGFCVGK